MVATILAAFKAIAALPEILSQIDSTINKIANNRTDANIQDIKDEIRVANEKFKGAETREDMLKIMRELNSASSK